MLTFLDRDILKEVVIKAFLQKIMLCLAMKLKTITLIKGI